MKLWKVLGGVVIGVAAVAAAPFTGGGSIIGAASLATSLAGTGTICLAVAAGGTGAAVAAYSENTDSKKRRQASRDGFVKGKEEGLAQANLKVKEYLVTLEKGITQQKEMRNYVNLVIALFAVGMTTADSNGKPSRDQILQIEEFVVGVAHSDFPPYAKGIMTKMKNSPPTFNEAMRYVNRLDNIDNNLFESVIEVVSATDGTPSKKERAVLDAFRMAVA